jgi:hypothetical protein
MRTEAPVRWNPSADGYGFWSLTRGANISSVNQDAGTFSSANGIWFRPDAVGPLNYVRNLSMLKDPPEHTRYRGIVAKVFLPRTLILVAGGEVGQDCDLGEYPHGRVRNGLAGTCKAVGRRLAQSGQLRPSSTTSRSDFGLCWSASTQPIARPHEVEHDSDAGLLDGCFRGPVRIVAVSAGTAMPCFAWWSLYFLLCRVKLSQVVRRRSGRSRRGPGSRSPLCRWC